MSHRAYTQSLALVGLKWCMKHDCTMDYEPKYELSFMSKSRHTHTDTCLKIQSRESTISISLHTHTHTRWILKKLLERFTSLRAFPGGLAHLLQLKLKRSGDGRESKTTFPKRKGKQRRKIKQFVLVFDPLIYIYIYITDSARRAATIHTLSIS